MDAQEKKSTNTSTKFIDSKNKSKIINAVVAEILAKNQQIKSSFIEKLSKESSDSTKNNKQER